MAFLPRGMGYPGELMAEQISFSESMARDHARAVFNVEGFVRLPGFLGPEELARLAGHGLSARQTLLERSKERLKGLKPSQLTTLKGLQDHNEWFEQLAQGGDHLTLLEDMLGVPLKTSTIAFVDRPPGSVEGIVPHIDGVNGEWDAKGGVTLWIALDQMDLDNGCLYYVRGSHLIPRKEKLYVGGYDQHSEGAVPVPVNPGDAVIHHALTVHWSGGNHTQRERRAVSFFCRRADA